jgi:hypothetical protein
VYPSSSATARIDPRRESSTSNRRRRGSIVRDYRTVHP